MSCMSNMEELRREAEELKSIEREVKEKVTQANKIGEKIDEHVNIWLKEANIIGMKVSKLLVDAKPKSKLLNKLLFPCRRSKKPIGDDIINSVKVLVDQGYNIFPTKGIELIWRDGFADFHSRRSTFAKIMESLKDDGIGIIGISGLGGIGKTRLVTEIGKKAKDEKLFDQVLMATVSQEPDIRNIQGTLADMLDLKFKDDDEMSRANELRSRFKRRRKVLVILDDVWEILDLDSIGVPVYSNQKGCKIVVTTRRVNVCKDMSCNLVAPLDKIMYDEAWDLFKEYADLNDKKSNNFMSKARKIARKCGGLPLAIVVVGSALRGKDFEDYEDALERLNNSKFVNVESADMEIYPCLKLSYDYLKDEDAKKCFLLCSVFPEDSSIFALKLARYAHGQCLFQNVNSIDEARLRIFASIEKLEDAGLLSPVPRTRHRKGNYFQTWPVLKMHDMVRAFALWITEENGASSFVLTSKNEEIWMRNYKNATSMYLTRFKLEWKNFPNKVKCPNLKMLIVSSHVSMVSFEKYQGVFEVTSALQVLDMSSKSSHTHNVLPPISLETLKNLRNLHLDGAVHSRSKEMSMIGLLQNLEILELSLGLQQTVLPKCIGELSNLRLLDLSRWYGLRLIPCNILPKLTKLEELYTPAFHIPDYKCHWDTNFLSDLKFLPCLTAFAGQFMGFQTLPDDSRFGNLQRYYINCRPHHLKNEDIRWTKTLGLDEYNELSEKVFSKLLPGVECLKIVGQEYIRGFQNLCPQIDNAGFQNLRELILECIYSLEYLIDTTGSGVGLPSLTAAFPNLVNLTLENITLLRKMCHGKLPGSYFSELKSAAIINCRKLKNVVPDMLPIGPKLEELEVEECYPMKYVYDLVEEQSSQHTQIQLQFLPCPKVLELYDLHQLQSIWNVPPQLELIDKHYYVELCKLVVRCLESLVTFKLHKSLELEEVFPRVELNSQRSDAQLSNLVELDLLLLPKLKCIWKGYQHYYSLQNLERIKLDECDALTTVFTSSHARSLQKLQYLVINNCKALETIVTLDDQDEAMRLSHTSTSFQSFQEIKKIDISSCNKLKTILPISFVAMELPKLESIDIKECAELEQVFGDHGQEIAAEGRKVVMNNLKELTLVKLPSLVRFSPLNCSISVSSLSQTVEQDYSGCMDLLNFLPHYEPHNWQWQED